MSDDPQYIINKNICYEEISHPLFSAWRPCDTPQGDPEPSWKGELIPWEMFRKITAFCQLSQIQFSAEAMVILFYDENAPEGQKWSWWAPPQETRGMSVSTLPDDPRYEEQRSRFPDLSFGSVHHHCAHGAHQSGVDHADEINREGLHFTLGKMGSKKHDIHMRFCICGESHTLEAEDFIALPECLPTGNMTFQQMREVVARFKDMLLEPVSEEVIKEWKPELDISLANVKKKTYNHQNHNFGKQHHFGNCHNQYWENQVLKKKSETPKQGELFDIEDNWFQTALASLERAVISKGTIPLHRVAFFMDTTIDVEYMIKGFETWYYMTPEDGEHVLKTLQKGFNNPMDQDFLAFHYELSDILFDKDEMMQSDSATLGKLINRFRIVYRYVRDKDLRDMGVDIENVEDMYDTDDPKMWQ